jgi:hypothetical protein
VTSEYQKLGNAKLIACSYPNLANDLKQGSQILCADGSLVLEVLEALPAQKCCRCRCVNTAEIGCASSFPVSSVGNELSVFRAIRNPPFCSMEQMHSVSDNDFVIECTCGLPQLNSSEHVVANTLARYVQGA